MAGAKALAVEPVALPVRSDAAIETAITGLAHQQAALAAMDDLYSSPASYNHFLVGSQQRAGDLPCARIC